MWKDSRENAGAAMSGDAMPGADALAKSPEGGRPLAARGPVSARGITAQSLGSAEFKSAYGVKYAYASGAMYRGIASSQMVVRMAKAGMLSFLGTGGLPLTKIAEEIAAIQSQLKNGEAFGVNLLFQPSEPWIEEEQVDFYIKERIRCAEVSAYMQSLSAPLVKYRLSGAVRNGDGTVTVPNKVLAKLSRPEVATAFLSPPPPALVAQLREQNKITAAEAEIASAIPMADDICVEADSGGHTDRGVSLVLLPAMILLRDEMMHKHRYRRKIRVGAAGGIGLPAAAAAAFVMGADFIVTGSINQCTLEAATSSQVKDMLQAMNVQDTEHAPAGDMFELGAKVQVLKKGIFFPARANKLYEMYRRYHSLDEIDAETRRQIEDRYFKRSFADVYEDTKAYYRKRDPRVLEAAEKNPKLKMALVFRWYFGYTNQLALTGAPGHAVDYQIHTGPALGAFNQWVRGTELENWRNRHVDEIGLHLLNHTAALLNSRFAGAGNP